MLNVVMLCVAMLNVMAPCRHGYQDRIFKNILNLIMLNLIMLNVIMLNVNMLNVIMLNVITLNVIMLSHHAECSGAM